MAAERKRLISKSDYIKGLRCPKLLWYKIHKGKDTEVFPETSPATQLLFDQGHEVGELAQKLYKDAVMIGWEWDAEKVTARSAEALKTGKTLFEAGFAVDGTYSIADIIVPVKGKKMTYDLIEVKMATAAKDYYYDDIAFQKYNYEKFGLKIRNCFLKLVNKEFVFDGKKIDPEKFFLPDIDVNTEVAERIPAIPEAVKKLHEIIANDKPPKVDIGMQCEEDSGCDIIDFCWKAVPKGSVLTLHGMKRKQKFDYYDSGNKLITDLPKHELIEKHSIMFDALKTGEEQVDKEKIADFLETLEYPLYYLDFETLMNLAVPKFKGTHPYQQIPFQFSLHVQEKKGGPATHHMFLAEGTDDPRPKCAEALDRLLGTKGTVLTYNQTMEKGVIEKLGEDFPKFRKRAENIVSRIKDLLVPFRGFAYYHPAQEGSASLKDVLPAMIGESYEGLAITEGGDAGALYLQAYFKDASEEMKAKIRKDLIEYCTQDTIAMVMILGKLNNIG